MNEDRAERMKLIELALDHPLIGMGTFEDRLAAMQKFLDNGSEPQAREASPRGVSAYFTIAELRTLGMFAGGIGEKEIADKIMKIIEGACR